jgi:uncharacterized FlaG/YvyC family protein
MSVHLKELLRMAHEQLDSQSAMITKLASRLQYAQGDKISAIAKERKRWAREDLAALEIRDLEQQAKGIEVAVRINLTSYSEPYTVKLMARATELRNKAKALKEDNQ